MGFIDILAGTGIQAGCGWVERQAQVAFYTGHWCAHFVAGSADEFRLLALFGALAGNITEDNNYAFAGGIIQRRHGDIELYSAFGAGEQRAAIVAGLQGIKRCVHRVMVIRQHRACIILQAQHCPKVLPHG